MEVVVYKEKIKKLRQSQKSVTEEDLKFPIVDTSNMKIFKSVCTRQVGT